MLMKKIIRYHCINPECTVEGGAYFEGEIMSQCPRCKSTNIVIAGDKRRFASWKVGMNWNKSLSFFITSAKSLFLYWP